MPGRKFTVGNGYRYGFNGKENDNEVKGDGNQQDYGMRIYDPRLGKFLSMDPLSKNYPMLTPYQFASNRPVDGIDLDGLEYMKAKTSIYGLNKFQVSTKYAEGALEIRNSDIHKIVMNHPRNIESSGEDDSTPEVAMVKKRSSSGGAQARQRSEANDAKRNMASDILGGIIAAIEWGYNTYYDKKYKNELQIASESIHSLNSADILVRAAYNSPGFPEELKKSGSNKALTDLTNFVTDGTTPTESQPYSILIETWGRLIYDNREEILNGKFNFSPETIAIRTKTTTTNGGEVRYEIKIEDKVGNPNPAVKAAHKLLKKASIPPATTVKQSE